MQARLALFVVLVAPLSSMAFGCDDLPRMENPDAHFERGSVLISPGTITQIHVNDVVDRRNLSLRMSGNAAEGEILEDLGVFDGWQVIEVVARGTGEADVELLDGDTVIDTLHVEVVDVDHLELTPDQSWFGFPDVASPFSVVPNHDVVLVMHALDASGRRLDEAREYYGALGTTDPDVEIEYLDRNVRIRIATPGQHTLTMTLDDAMLDLDVNAGFPEDVVALEIDVIERGTEGVGISISGVTEAGVHVLGLSPVLTIDGVEEPSAFGDDLAWLFERDTVPMHGTVEATWNGLTTTW